MCFFNLQTQNTKTNWCWLLFRNFLMQNAEIIAQLLKMNSPAMQPPTMTIMDGLASENAYLQISVFQCTLFIIWLYLIGKSEFMYMILYLHLYHQHLVLRILLTFARQFRTNKISFLSYLYKHLNIIYIFIIVIFEF